MSGATTNSESEILSRMISPAKPDLTEEAARAILRMDFPQADRERMEALSEKGRAGTLSSAEQEELDSYERVGSLIGILRSKARRSLENRIAE